MQTNASVILNLFITIYRIEHSCFYLRCR